MTNRHPCELRLQRHPFYQYLMTTYTCRYTKQVELKLDVMDMFKIYYEERVENFLLLWTA